MQHTLPGPHPGLSQELNDQIAQTMIEGGADLRRLKTGQAIEATTRNTKYRIERVHDGEKNFPFLMSGHPRLCPEPTRAAISGSSHGGGMLRLGFVGRGMRMEFRLANKDRGYMTTEIAELVEAEPGSATPNTDGDSSNA